MNGLVFVMLLAAFGLIVFGGLNLRGLKKLPMAADEPERDWNWSLDPNLQRERMSRRR